MHNIGIRGHDLGDDLNTICQEAKKNNINHIQLALAKVVSDVNFDSVGYDKEVSSKICDTLNSYKVEASVTGCYINPINADDSVMNTEITRFCNFLKYAKDFSSRCLGTETGVLSANGNISREEALLRFEKNFENVALCAEENDVFIGIEPVFCTTINSPKMLKRFIDDMQSKKIGMILDPANMMGDDSINSRDLIDESIDLLGDRIIAVHIKDFSMVNNQKTACPIGEGIVDIKHCINEITKLQKDSRIIMEETTLDWYYKGLKYLG